MFDKIREVGDVMMEGFLGGYNSIPVKASTWGVYYDFHKELDFTLIFEDCGEYTGYYSCGLWCLEKGYYETAYEYLKIAVYNRRDDSRYAHDKAVECLP